MKENKIKVERIHQTGETGSTKAFCDILVNDTFIVKGLRIVEGKEGLFVSMPREKGKNGQWYDTFYPISSEVKKELQSVVLEEFKNAK